MKAISSGKLVIAVVTAALSVGATHAVTFKMANQGDALSLDPHSLNESLQLSFLTNIYEPLVNRGKDMKVVPGLATSWKQTAPTVWRFELRKGVKFHDGSPFTADDVVFSVKRGQGEGSDVKGAISEIADVKKIDDFTIEVITKQPFPILPDVITTFLIMPKKWSEDNRATQPVDKRKGVENTASFKANGTGPFRVKAREPGVRTTLVRNLQYWDKVESNVDEVIFTPIGSPATRVAALLSGEIDMMEPVPLQDVARIDANPQTKVLQGPELRTIFLGMDQKRDELLFSSVKGKNPFKDKRVRQAFYQAIDIESIKTNIMRGAATPSALMVAPGVNGAPTDLNKRLPFDADVSRKLLTDAGYPNGFEVKMNCPNDRYVNDAAICTAVVGMLAKVGIKINLEAESKATYFPKILRRDTSFYLLGWTPSTLDSHDVLNALIATPSSGGQGQFNLGSYSNPKVDELTGALARETDQNKRNAMIREAMKLHMDDIGHLPLHQQALAWAMRRNVTLVQAPTNYMQLKWVVKK
jgi:peptide/nickel transport system substrate-binding protein